MYRGFVGWLEGLMQGSRRTQNLWELACQR